MQTLGKKEELGLNKWRAIAKEMPGAAFEGLAIRYFKDRNNDGRLDAGETLSGEMFHTTPDNEASPAASMYESHGCIHLRPAQRDRMMNAGGFRRGMPLVIHTYSERFSP